MTKRPTANLPWILSSLVLASGLTAHQAVAQYGARPQGNGYPVQPAAQYNQPPANQPQTASDDPYDPFVWSAKQQRASGRAGWRPVQPAAPATAPAAAPQPAHVAQPQARTAQTPIRGQVVPAASFTGRGRVRPAAHYVQPGPAPTMGEQMASQMNYGGAPVAGPMVPYPHHPGMDHHHTGPGCKSCGGGMGGPMHSGPVYQGGEYEDYGWEGGPSCSGPDCGGDSCGGCNACPNPCGVQPCCTLFQLPYHIELFAGTHGFKGPRDFGINGNFGFQEGINTAGALNMLPNIDLNYQVGWQAVQSNLSGTQFEDDTRHQYFLTAGLFHRQVCGLQYGVVWDWYRDYYYDDIDLTQLRAQISLLNQAGHELGFAANIATNDDTDIAGEDDDETSIRWEGTNQFVGFYRVACPCSGDIRAWGGFTGDGDGIVGADFRMPLNDCFSIMGSTNYLIPEEGSGPTFGGPENEAWNLSINLVWHYGGRARQNGPCRWKPMFDVADNGSFMVQVQEPDEDD